MMIPSQPSTPRLDLSATRKKKAICVINSIVIFQLVLFLLLAVFSTVFVLYSNNTSSHDNNEDNDTDTYTNYGNPTKVQLLRQNAFQIEHDEELESLLFGGRESKSIGKIDFISDDKKQYRMTVEDTDDNTNNYNDDDSAGLKTDGTKLETKRSHHDSFQTRNNDNSSKASPQKERNGIVSVNATHTWRSTFETIYMSLGTMVYDFIFRTQM